MLYELRHYDVQSDRGMRFVVQRFNDHILSIWERIGIEPAGFWTVFVGPNSPRLTYILAWEDLAQREQLWHQFETDAEWRQIRDESNAAFGGSPIHTITNTILQQTSISPVPRRDNQPSRLTGGVFELRVAAFPDYDSLYQGVEWFGTQALPLLGKHRMHCMGFWTTLIGISPRLTYMLVFESQADRERTWAAYHTDPQWPAVEECLYPNGKPLIIGTESCLMRGTEFSGWR